MGDWKRIRRFHAAPRQVDRVGLDNLEKAIFERRDLANRTFERMFELSALLDSFLEEPGGSWIGE